MKKVGVVLLSLLMLLTLCSCGTGQIADGLQLKSAGSEVYTEEEISDAAEVVLRIFQENFSGCTMTSLRYPGDQTSALQEWAEQYDADQAIVLTSSFDVEDPGSDSTLNPNSTYDHWQWVLVRDEGGQWEAKTWGLG